MKWVDAFIAMWYRQVKRFLRAKPRLIGTFLHPIFWLLFFGIGFAGAFRKGVSQAIFMGLSYLEFFLPGIAMMGVFTGAFMSGISVIWDKEFGYLKVVLVSPASRKASILGRIIGDSTIVVFQSVVLLLLGYLLVPSMNIINLPFYICIAFLVSISFAGIGVIIATKMQTIEGFQLIVNIITLPLMFLSGIFYPIHVAPSWIQPIILANPLTYGVDAARFVLVGKSYFNILLDIVLLGVLSMILIFLTMHQFEKATIG